MANINGTPGDDVIYGTNGDDYIQTLSGNDKAYGGAGDDTLVGGDPNALTPTGSSYLDGGLGNDTLIGFAAVNTLYDHDGGDDSFQPHYTSTIDILRTAATSASTLTIDGPPSSQSGPTSVAFIRQGNVAFDTVDIRNLSFSGDIANALTVNIDTSTAVSQLPGSGPLSIHDGGSLTITASGGVFDIYHMTQASIQLGSGPDTVTLDANGGAYDVRLHDPTVGNPDDNLVILDSTHGASLAGSIVIDDFKAGVGASGSSGGDQISLQGQDHNTGSSVPSFLRAVLTNWDPSVDPFDDGHLQVVQSGADTLLQIDPAGGGTSYQTLITLKNVVTTSLTAFNFFGLVPVDQPPMTLVGGAGNDVLTGGDNADHLTGNAGDDLLIGGYGSDTLDGGSGNDTLYAMRQTPGAATDSVSAAQVGRDVLYGGDGNDTLYGRDSTPGANGNAYLDGGAGNDTLVSYGGDTLIGGDGNDTIVTHGVHLPPNYYVGAQTNYGYVSVDAGAGDDTVHMEIPGIVKLGPGADSLYAIAYPGSGFTTVVDFNPAEGDHLEVKKMLVDYFQPTPTQGVSPSAYHLHYEYYPPGLVNTFDPSRNPFADGHLSLVQVGNDVELIAEGIYNTDRFGEELILFQNITLAAFTAASLDGYDPNPPGILHQGTQQDFQGATLPALSPDDRIHLTDATYATFSYTDVNGSIVLPGAASASPYDSSRPPLAATFTTPGRLAVNADPTNGVLLTHAAHDASLQDLNADGHSDLIWREADGRFSTWDVTGNVTANATVDNVYLDGSVDNSWHIQGTFDFNGDGQADLVWRNAVTGAFTIWESNGAGFTQNSYADGSVDTSWSMQVLADFNGDGKDDLLWRNANGTFTEWQSTGTGFTPNTYINSTVGTDWHIVGAGDFNGDGKADLLWRNANGSLTIWDSTGAGFTPNVYAADVDTTWHVQAVADFNGDGKSDILWRNNDGRLTIWTSTGSGFAQNTYENDTLDPTWTLMQTGDFNGDGKADLLFRHNTGEFAIWQSTGGGFTENVLVDSTVHLDWMLQTHHYDIV